jgi:hypothetical protein
MEIHDSLNNQFRLNNYIAKLNNDLLQYLDNNNIDINYYCFFSNVINNKHYIITSQTIKRNLNGYKLITIKDTDKGNNIFERVNNLEIIYESVCIKITSIIDDLSDVTKKLGIIIKRFDSKLVENATINYVYNYDKDLLESNIIKAINVKQLNVLHNFKNLRDIVFSVCFNQKVCENILPKTLQSLIFQNLYNNPIGISVLPNSLQSLTFSDYYNQSIGISVLPNSLKILAFGCLYNQPIGVNVLHDSLKTLTFSTMYNQPIGINVLPNSLKTLTFTGFLNQIICQNVLPNSLKTLVFGECYNQTIGVNILPNSLQILTFSNCYNKTINENVLPNSIQIIYFSNSFGNIYPKKSIVPQTFKNRVKYINLNGEILM